MTDGPGFREERFEARNGPADHDWLHIATRSSKRFTPIAVDDIVLREEPPYLVEGLIPRGPSLTVVVGKDKSGKTFLMMDALFHVAMGRKYCERTVEQGTVVYLTSEGIRGVERRLIALRRHHGVEGLSITHNFGPDDGAQFDVG